MRYAIAAVYLIVAVLAVLFFVTRPRPAPEKPPTAAPSASEAEFIEQHRQSILRVVDDAQWSRKLDDLTENSVQTAKTLGDQFGLPQSARPALEEFGGEYGRRLRGILENVRKELGPSVPPEKPWPPARVREMQDLDAWAQGRLAEIDAQHSKAIWDGFGPIRSGCYQLLKMP